MQLLKLSFKSSLYTKIGQVLLALLGWSTQINLPPVPKQIVIFAPHTSNWDFVFMILAVFSVGMRPNWIGKKELFWGPFNRLFQSLGGIPIDRSGKLHIVDQVVNYVHENDQVVIGIAPEGTRSKTPYWKTGFYHIANNARIHITFAYLDYKARTARIEPGILPSGNIQEDFELIRGYFLDKPGKNPKNIGPVQLKPRND